MFKIANNSNEVFTVYSVEKEGLKANFLIYKENRFMWVESRNFRPIKN